MIEPAVVVPGDLGSSLDAIDPQAIVGLLADRGVVVLRGFGADGAAFTSFSDRFGSEFTCDPHKVVAGGLNGAGGAVGKVARRLSRLGRSLVADRRPVNDAASARFAPFNGYGINPHNENCYLPGAFPDLVWFHCTRPAADGGRTILADGREVLDRLEPDAVRFAREQPIRYEANLTTPQWQAVWGVPDHDGLAAILDEQPGVVYTIDDDGRLDLTFDSVQVFPRRFDGADVVRTNLLSIQPFGGVNPSSTQHQPDGEPVPVEVLRALIDATSERTEVDLAAGDVILIDNSTVLHGRAPFTDRTRRVETRCGWLDDTLVS